LKTRHANIDRKTATRADLLDAVYVTCLSVSRAETRKVFETIFDEVSKAFVSGEQVKLRGFGVFSVREKSKRMGRNPRTGREAAIEPRRVLTFKPSPTLINLMNSGRSTAEPTDTD
jgi:integration host factor subunit alpha